MKGVELEQAIQDAIERTIITETDKEDAKDYLRNILVTDMIDEAMEE